MQVRFHLFQMTNPTVSVWQKTIGLRVDEVTSLVRRRSVSRPSAQETIYIGGVSGKANFMEKKNIILHERPFSA